MTVTSRITSGAASVLVWAGRPLPKSSGKSKSALRIILSGAPTLRGRTVRSFPVGTTKLAPGRVRRDHEALDDRGGPNVVAHPKALPDSALRREGAEKVRCREGAMRFAATR